MAQMPAIELTDGRWMTDTTAIIGWIEARRAGPEVTPRDPALRFFSLLLEDYADEWLWRPALHYRWSFQPDTVLMGRRIAAEMLRDVPGPLALRTAVIIARQQRKYVRGDGITPATRGAVEDLYRRTLAALEAILATRPFLLGDRPSLADFGFMGSMFRHFSLDPTPARIMRDTAPAVFEWVARMWNARASAFADLALLGVVPDDWAPFLAEAATGYLPYLAANAEAAATGQATFAVTLQGVDWRLPVNLNRVHCLKALQTAFEDLPIDAATAVRLRLDAAGAWAPLWRVTAPDIGFDPQGRLPFLTPETAWGPGSAPTRGRAPTHDGAAR
jgi:glutathione S-transferase